MLPKILSKTAGLTKETIFKVKYQISFKKMRDSMYQREKYFKDYQMTSNSFRIDHQKYKIYISPSSPEFVRTDQYKYRILGSSYNFNITFLENLDFMGKSFSWENRKNISLSFREILLLETVSQNNPVTVENEFVSVFNSEQSKTQKQLKVQLLQDGQTYKLTLSIVTLNDLEKWSGIYELNSTDYAFLVQSAKKNIYYASGLKTTLELQRRQIIRMMDKRMVKDQEYQFKSGIDYDENKELLRQSEQNSEQPSRDQKKIRARKSSKDPISK